MNNCSYEWGDICWKLAISNRPDARGVQHNIHETKIRNLTPSHPP